jgi:hypothetical protein
MRKVATATPMEEGGVLRVTRRVGCGWLTASPNPWEWLHDHTHELGPRGG